MTISSIGGGFLPSSLGGAPLGSLATLALAVISATGVPLAAAASTAGSVVESAEKCKTACEKLKDGATVCWAGCMAVGELYASCNLYCRPAEWMSSTIKGAYEGCMAVCVGFKPISKLFGY